MVVIGKPTGKGRASLSLYKPVGSVLIEKAINNLEDNLANRVNIKLESYFKVILKNCES